MEQTTSLIWAFGAMMTAMATLLAAMCGLLVVLIRQNTSQQKQIDDLKSRVAECEKKWKRAEDKES